MPALYDQKERGQEISGRKSGEGALQKKYFYFMRLLAANNRALEIISDLELIFYQDKPFSFAYVLMQTEVLMGEVFSIVEDVNALSDIKYPQLFDVAEGVSASVFSELKKKKRIEETSLVLPLERLSIESAGDVGGKAANLGEIYNRVNLPVPQGFAVTAYACQQFLDYIGLTDRIEARLGDFDVNETESLIAVCEEIRRDIMRGELPPELEGAIREEMNSFKRKIGPDIRLSVRSSATSEDTEASFAGQHSTVLNVREEDLMAAYKKVVSSTFNPRAVFYRRRRGYLDQDVVMSVACIRMIDAGVSGVMYTVDPNDSRHGVIMISAVWGLGVSVVEGSGSSDFFQVNKQSGEIEVTDVGVKHTGICMEKEGGIREVAVAKELQERPCLDRTQIHLLTEYGIRLEGHYGHPLDIEWAIDQEDKLYILQARPLKRSLRFGGGEATGNGAKEPEQVLEGYPILLQGGVSASDGEAYGKACVILDEFNIQQIPEGAVVVVRQTSPAYVALMGKIQAIVTDVGSVTGHLATVAREFQIPTLVGTGNATQVIPEGEDITVDATNKIVYRGRAEALLKKKITINPMKGSPISRTVQEALKRIAPLNLTDPKKESFKADACRTVHDIIRFSHEMSMHEMFRIGEDLASEEAVSVLLKVGIPMKILIVDLGGGLALRADHKEARFENVASVPFSALLTGMTLRGVSWGRKISETEKGPAKQVDECIYGAQDDAPNYAILGANYLNFNARLGDYFATIDTYCGPRINDNYITFHFKGGAADIGRRSRRARFVYMVIRELGLKSEQKGDMVRGELKKYLSRTFEEKLDWLGRLLGCVCFLDSTAMNEIPVEWQVDRFFEQNYSFCDT